MRLKPTKYKHFQRGPSCGNILITRIRVGRSYLNAHKFSIGFVDSPQCSCGQSLESSLHYFTKCLLYDSQRQILYSLFEHYIPTFKNMTLKQKHDIILYGYNINNKDYLYMNTLLTLGVQKFIIQTKRFEER